MRTSSVDENVDRFVGDGVDDSDSVVVRGVGWESCGCAWVLVWCWCGFWVCE